MKKILLIFPPREKSSSNFYFRVRQQIEVLSKKYQLKIIEPISKTDSNKDRKSFIYRIVKFFFMIPEMIKQIKKTDIILVYMSPLWYITLPLVKIFRKKIILDHFTTSVYNFEIQKHLLQNIFRITDTLIYGKFDLVLTHSESMRDLICSFYKIPEPKVKVLYSCADTNKFKKISTMNNPFKRITQGKKVILHHGLFHPYHGVELIIKAVNRLSKDVILLIVGGKVKDKKNNVISLNPIDYDKIPELLSVADIWIGAVGKGLQGERAMSSNMIAAMSVGLPVIVGDCPENKKIIKDGINGYIVKRGDSKAISEKILLLLKDNKKRKFMGLNARQKIIREFSTNVIDKKTLKIFSEIE